MGSILNKLDDEWMVLNRLHELDQVAYTEIQELVREMERLEQEKETDRTFGPFRLPYD